MKRSTNLVIISGPSGSGKDAVISGLVERGLPIERVITTVTRPKRPGESEGNPYYFVDEPAFKELIAKNALAEWAQVDNDKYYGVTKTELERVKALKDKIGIWKIEYKGVASAKRMIPDILAILIAPPNLEALAERSYERGQQTDSEIQDRLHYSQEFMKHKNLYNYVVVNEEGKLEQTIDKVIEILEQEGYATI